MWILAINIYASFTLKYGINILIYTWLLEREKQHGDCQATEIIRTMQEKMNWNNEQKPIIRINTTCNIIQS